MKKKTKRAAALIMMAMMTVTSLTGCGNKDDSEKTTAAETTVNNNDTTGSDDVTDNVESEISEDDITAPDGYHLVWHDEFDGTELNEDDWNYEEHEVGWVNNELQEYIPNSEYAYVKDGELIIQPVKIEDDNGNISYASGRVNTQNKHDYTYGRFEARLKVPEGKGFLPAFWMMPQDESYYGQWPKCGEIDIMEVLGDTTNKLYGSLHFGEPHMQRQGTYDLTDGDFANEYHVFAVEWEPGEIRWYVDDVQYFETSDWFTAVEGEEEKPYPAPFNQPFHVILNVAVGGDWPGSPDETTVFDDRAAMKVDYVRIFQKDSYDENVEHPVEKLEMREADETGNFVYNSDFSDNEDLSDNENWKFLLASGGAGEATIENNEIIITSEKEGSEEYSVQLVQPEMPMEQGATYTFSFEAYAEEARQMKPAITAPDANWIRYFPDTPVDITTEWQTYTFTFDMTEASDDNGRVEFNMGNQESTATIHIRNVRLEKTETETIVD
ncbi:MAG: family 16 glycosylhydrolase [Lachnospiraceae bacterium]|nr:family 16 glycosylhydrolase [Lachnospiraceae bacterium]